MRNKVGVERGRNKVSFYVIVICELCDAIPTVICELCDAISTVICELCDAIPILNKLNALWQWHYLLSKGLERNATNELICKTETDS